jgi:Tfp pilus assembly PilM family ATPase
MSNLVAFEVEDEHLLIAVARTSQRRMVIERAFDIKLAAEDSDEEIGNRMRRWLASNGIHRADALAVVSRSSAEIRELEVPPAPDDELPDLVRFKARSDFGSLNDAWSLDFVPFSNDPGQPRQVLAVAISPELSKQITAIADAAGVKLKHIVFRPYATVDLLRTKLADGRCRIIVDETGEQTDISLTDGNQLVATRTVLIPQTVGSEARATQLLREVRRTITSMSKRLNGKNVSEIVICGEHAGDAEQLENSFVRQIEVETHILEPFRMVDTRGGFKQPEKSESYTALLGALSQHAADGKHTIDFLNPRKRPDGSTDFSRYYRSAGIVAAALLLLAMLGWWMLRSQESEIAELKSRLDAQLVMNESLDNPANNVDRILNEVAPIDRFLAEAPNWLDEVYNISTRMKTPDDIIVDLFDAGVRRNGPEIDLTGRVSDSETETEIRKDLLSLESFIEVLGNKVARSDDPNFPESFGYKIQMNVPPLNQVKQEVNARASEWLRERNQLRTRTTDDSETN